MDPAHSYGIKLFPLDKKHALSQGAIRHNKIKLSDLLQECEPEHAPALQNT